VRSIEKARRTCQSAGYNISDHVLEVRKMVGIGSGARCPSRTSPSSGKIERRLESEGKKLPRRVDKLEHRDTAAERKDGGPEE